MNPQCHPLKEKKNYLESAVLSKLRGLSQRTHCSRGNCLYWYRKYFSFLRLFPIKQSEIFFKSLPHFSLLDSRAIDKKKVSMLFFNNFSWRRMINAQFDPQNFSLTIEKLLLKLYVSKTHQCLYLWRNFYMFLIITNL